jgi:hypothetical protein
MWWMKNGVAIGLRSLDHERQQRQDYYCCSLGLFNIENGDYREYEEMKI